MSDAVNKPDHYNQGSIECIEAMKIVLTPEEFRGYLKGNVFKYFWREKDKNGNEDIRKGKAYFDLLIELIDKYEQQKAGDLQSLKDHPFGKLKKPKWTPKIGDWVRINAPEPGDPMHTKTLDDLDGHILQVVGQSEFDKRYAAFKSDHGSFYVLIDLLEPAEQPEATVEVIGEVTGEVKPPDGWRWIEVGEVLRRSDASFNSNGSLYELNQEKAGRTVTAPNIFIRRNRFEVGEKVIDCRSGVVFTVQHFDKEHLIVFVDGVSNGIESKYLAPYIEETK